MTEYPSPPRSITLLMLQPKRTITRSVVRDGWLSKR